MLHGLDAVQAFCVRVHERLDILEVLLQHIQPMLCLNPKLFLRFLLLINLYVQLLHLCQCGQHPSFHFLFIPGGPFVAIMTISAVLATSLAAVLVAISAVFATSRAAHCHRCRTCRWKWVQ
jgi:hypothetical protein